MLDSRINKTIKRIYEFNLKDTFLLDGHEMITNNGISDFNTAFSKKDLDYGIIVTPNGPHKGLVYKSSHGGEFYNNPRWEDIEIPFSFNIYGLKKNAFYKITVIARNTGSDYVVTNNRKLTVITENNELLIDANLSGENRNKEFSAIFKSDDNDSTLMFKIGKIYVNNIIIDEVELDIHQEDQEEDRLTEYDRGANQMVSFGVFGSQVIDWEHGIGTIDSFRGRYYLLNKFAGKGINLYYDKITDEYILERDNVIDTIGENFTNMNYKVDINLNKIINNGSFDRYDITEISPDASPNTLRSGFIKFRVLKGNEIVKHNKLNGRITVVITKLF